MAKYKKAQKKLNNFEALEKEIQEKESQSAKQWDPDSQEWRDHVGQYYEQ